MILVVGGGEEKNVTVGSSSMFTNVTGLLPGTHYTFRVVVVSVLGGVQAASPPSDVINTTTALSGEILRLINSYSSLVYMSVLYSSRCRVS